LVGAKYENMMMILRIRSLLSTKPKQQATLLTSTRILQGNTLMRPTSDRLIGVQNLQNPNKVYNRYFSESKTKSETTKPTAGGSDNNHVTPKDEDLFVGTHIWRLACAFGIVYCFSEYIAEWTICEGPSMLPTIQSRGEIILVDRVTPRIWGINGGTVGSERVRQARVLQRRHEQSRDRPEIVWYDPRIPVNRLRPEGAWDRLRERLTTGISVGDVVVVEHPDRIGTVCKRVMGLPGDIVTKPSRRRRTRGLQRRNSSSVYVIPDGHIWIEGDNPWNSSDSRNYGSIPAAMIVGRVLLRVWPLRGNALMERGYRPDHDETNMNMAFSGTVVLPAGYSGERFVVDPNGRSVAELPDDPYEDDSM
jgi:signal peptidase I